MTDQKDADRGFEINCSQANAGQRENSMLTPKPQFHMNLISQEPQPGNHLFDNKGIKRRQS